MATTAKWKAISARKQVERAAKIPQAWRLTNANANAIAQGEDIRAVPRRSGLLTEQELKITGDYDASALLNGLASKDFSSEQVVTAFCKRAAIAQQVTNCLTEILFDEAIARARELDEYLWKHGKPVGPLHGLPVSLKDTFNIRTYDSSVGVASLCFKPATTNAALVDLLVSLGAVMFCKTNVPQTMSALDSHNNVFGRTINPANVNLTAGGSSGGEGALIAMRGSILGIGTDIGGSIRIPAACNNLYGVKPSHGRVPYAGQESGSKPGTTKLGIEPTAGPIATSARDCELILKAITNARADLYDPDVVAQTWDEQAKLQLDTKNDQRLRIGIIRTDGHVKPLPPIERLMEDVAKTLRSTSNQAFEVIEIDAAPVLSRVVKTFNGFMSIGGANDWFDLLEQTGEPLSPWLEGRLVRRAQKSLDEVRSLHAQRIDLQTAFLNIWNESGGHWLTDASEAMIGDRTLDVIVMPVAPHPVPGIDRWNTVNYTSALNVLDLSTGVLPVRHFTTKDLEGEVPDSSPLNSWDKRNRELWTTVDRNVYLDSPLSVQVVSPRLTERKLVEAMAKIDGALEVLRRGKNSSDRYDSKL